MLVKLIRNPAYKGPSSGVLGLLPGPSRTLQREQQHHPRHTLTRVAPAAEDFVYPADWTKLKFSQWIAGVQEKFKKGMLVTLDLLPAEQNKIPFYFRVQDVAEIQKFCQWDKQAYEPAAILVETRDGKLYRKAPSTLRPLTEEELKLVILQNTKPAGTA